MKKTNFLPVVALLAGLLVACGGGTNTASSSKAPASSKKPTASSQKHEHTYNEAVWESNDSQHWHPATCDHTTQKGSAANHTFETVAAESKASTCKEAGVKVEKCSVCGYKKTTNLPKAAHTWGGMTAEVKEEGKSGYKTQTCTTCGAQDFVLNALTWTKLEGTNKDSSNDTLKLKANGDYTEYEFTCPVNMVNAEVALFGWVDYWKDGSNNNDQRGHIVNGSATFSITVNGADVAVTNTQTFEEMGMTEGANGNGSFTLCPVGGTATLNEGATKVVYTRVASYNLNITEIHFIGKTVK